jgi:hypothetical protein
MNHKPINLFFEGKASEDLSRYFERKLSHSLPFNLLGCFVNAVDEDINGVTYTLSIESIAEIEMKPAERKETFSRYRILKDENGK